MMKCTELENLALDYVDGSLGVAERGALDAHLSGCAACAARLSEFSAGFGATHQTLDTWPSAQPSRNFDRQVLDRIAAEASRPAGLANWWNHFIAPFFASLMRPAFAGTLSAVLLVSFAVVRFMPGAGGDLNPSPALSPDLSFDPSFDPTVAALDTSEAISLYQDLSDLDDLDMLRNFEVLQEMKGPTP